MKYKVTLFEYTLYNGNFFWDFYWYCVKRNKKILLWLFPYIGSCILTFFHLRKKENHFKKSFQYLKNITNLESTINDFWNQYQEKIGSWFLLQDKKTNWIVMSSIPDILLKPILKKIKISKVITSKMNDKFMITDNLYNPNIKLLAFYNTYPKGKIEVMYASKKENLPLFEASEKAYIVKKNHCIPYKKTRLLHTYRNSIITFLLLFILSALITLITLIFSQKVADLYIITELYLHIDVLLLNFLPIFFIMILLYSIINRLWASFGITATLFTILAFVNRTKLILRDDPVIFSDIKLISESLTMAQKYPIVISPLVWKLAIILLVITILLFIFHKQKITHKKGRISSIAVLLMIGIIGYTTIYSNSKLYDKIGDKNNINIWSFTQQYQVRGFVYPFLYSSTQMGLQKPDGYNEKLAQDTLEQYSYENIPENEKVNIIAIMLESYNDFSKFDLSFEQDIYKNFHNICQEAYCGTLVNNIFGGGTINTERNFLTGYYNLPEFRSKTNSFVWYFKEQGYYTEATHPVYGWFYNRRNVNENIGFDNFNYYENKYQGVQYAFLEDQQFFYYIETDYENHQERNMPYFHFSVTYQNHGPYLDTENEKQYLTKKPEYDEKLYNTINNYFEGISKTDAALKQMVEYFRKEEEPTILIFFGDHNPGLGEAEAGYAMLQIDIDQQSEQGFYNYYETPYLIWANDSAKKVTGKSFKGDAPTISPNYLMVELFDYLEWKGNPFMQVLSDLKKDLPVIHNNRYLVDNTLVSSLEGNLQQKFTTFESVSYYYANHYQS